MKPARDPIKSVPKKYRPAGELTRCPLGHEYVSGNGCMACKRESNRKAQEKLRKRRAPVTYEYRRATPVALDRDQLAVERAASRERRRVQLDAALAQVRAREAARIEVPDREFGRPGSRILTRTCTACGDDFDQIKGLGRPRGRCPRCVRLGVLPKEG